MTTPTQTTGMIGYHPEMGEARPESQIDASMSHYGDHWFLKTPLTLSGRGVKLLRTLTAGDLVPQAQHKVGWHEYKVTEAAFQKICNEHKVAVEFLL